MTRDRANWLLFGLLGLIWGSSYLFIKIGVDAAGPFTLVTLRCLFAAAFLALVVRAAHEPLPRSGRVFGHLVVTGILSIFLPFVLIAWGELHVTTGLAAVLNATTPLFTILAAAAVLPDEPVRINRVVGLLVGFAGVAVVVAPSLVLAPGLAPDHQALPAQAAIVVAAASYALGAVYVRRFLSGVRPMTISLGMVVVGFLLTAPLAIALEASVAVSGFGLPLLGASAWLGVLGSGVALLIFYRLLHDRGATATHVVVYLLPPVGVAIGVVVLGEPLHVGLLIGTVLIIGGAALTHLRLPGPRVLGERAAAPE